jgi:hypothetical protein
MKAEIVLLLDNTCCIPTQNLWGIYFQIFELILYKYWADKSDKYGKGKVVPALN